MVYKKRMKLATVSAMHAPSIGIAVRFTKSNGEIPAIPADTTITAVIGEIARAALAIKCIGRIMSTVGTPVETEIVGTKWAKAKKGALPEPITTEDTPIIDTITRVIPMPPNPDVLAHSMRAEIVPWP